jgi:hypothetical protein
MSNQYFPPIPGKIGHRGRPSLEEMEERKEYWKTKNGPPNCVQPEPVKKLTPIIINSDFNAKKAEMVEIAENLITVNNDIPESIQKLISTCPVELSKEDKKSVNDLLKKLPPSKRGRPSREDQKTREWVEDKINAIIVQKIQSSGGMIIVNLPKSTSQIKIDPSDIGVGITTSTVHQFKFGDQVRIVDSPMWKSEMGLVFRHDIGSLLVFVAWKGGHKSWHGVAALVPFKATKKEIEEMMEEDNKPQLPIDEKTFE